MALSRRKLGLYAAGAMAATATAMAIPGRAGAAAARPEQRSASECERVRVRTSAGPIEGERSGALTVFRGVPYAKPPIKELRFASPRPPEPWTEVRDATKFAAASLQAGLDGSDEDSLYANVWTPDTEGRRPVLVYIHGGGWAVGAGSLPGYDGARLAERGDLVVVNFNYRLGVFGFGLHEDFTDPTTGSYANWGLQDQAALLHWVRENAAAFGGDPDNITLAGTSAGGSSTWQLALLPQLRGVIKRIVPISACHVWDPSTSLTPQDSCTVHESLARGFGTGVKGLREVPAAELMRAWDKVFAGSPTDRLVDSGREFRGPVVDGRWMPGYDHQRPTPDLPIMAVYARNEGGFYTGPYPPVPPPTPAPTNGAELRAAVRGVLLKGATEVPDSLVDGAVAAYREAAVAEGLPTDPLSLWTEIWGDGLFRYQDVRLAQRHARGGSSPQYVMEFAHPARKPYVGTPHEATSPFLFGTYNDPEALAGTWPFPADDPPFVEGELERTVSDAFIDLVASFAAGSAPSSEHVSAWPEFDPASSSTLILGGEPVARVEHTPKLRQLEFWDEAGWVPRT